VINLERYLSQLVVPGIGTDGQKKIAAAKILVIGAGGLGCPVLTYLAAMGIGTIGIVDNDIVEMKNLHRQVLYNETDTGKLKVQVAREKLQLQNSGIRIVAYPERLTENNASQLFSDHDMVIDCCDNVETRYIIDQYTSDLGKPFVYGAVRQLEGQVSVFNYKDGPSYKHLFPDEELAKSELDCATAGIIGYVPGMVGCLQVNEAVKIILGDDAHILSGEILTINLHSLIFRKFKIKNY
jgi:sulfur-carrier protein adenylyltransferase/sulfurtransferase